MGVWGHFSTVNGAFSNPQRRVSKVSPSDNDGPSFTHAARHSELGYHIELSFNIVMYLIEIPNLGIICNAKYDHYD